MSVGTITGLRSNGYSGYSWSIWSAVKSGAIIARSVSSSMLVRRSQAIAFNHATESSGVQGSIS